MLTFLLKLAIVACWLAPEARGLSRSGRGFRFVPIGDGGGTERITDPYYIEFLLGRLKRDIPDLFPSTSRRSVGGRVFEPHDYQEFILGKRSERGNAAAAAAAGSGLYVIRKGGEYFVCSSRQAAVGKRPAPNAYDSFPEVDFESFLLGKRDSAYCRPLALGVGDNRDETPAYDQGAEAAPDKRTDRDYDYRKRSGPDVGGFPAANADRRQYDVSTGYATKRPSADFRAKEDGVHVTGRSLPEYIDFIVGRNRRNPVRKRRSVPAGSATNRTAPNGDDTGNGVERRTDYVTERKRAEDDGRDYVPQRGYFSFRDFLFGHKRIPDYGQFILGKKSGRDFIETLQGRSRRLLNDRNAPDYDAFLMGSRKRAFLMDKKPAPDYEAFVLGKKNDAGTTNAERFRTQYDAFLMGKRNAPDYDAFLMGKRNAPDYDAFLMGKKLNPSYEEFLMGKKNTPDYERFLMGKKADPDYGDFLLGKKSAPDYERFLMGKKYMPEYEEFLMGKRNTPDYERFLMGKKYTPEYEEFLMGKKSAPDYEKFILGKKNRPDYENFLMGKKSNPDYEKFLIGKKYTPSYDEFLMGKKNQPDYENFLMGKKNNPDYERFLMGKKHTPQYEEFLMGKKHTPDYEQFLMGKKNAPDYEKFLMGKKDTPDYANFLMGKKEAPDFERFLMGKKAPTNGQISDAKDKMDYGAFLMGKKAESGKVAPSASGDEKKRPSESVDQSSAAAERRSNDDEQYGGD